MAGIIAFEHHGITTLYRRHGGTYQSAIINEGRKNNLPIQWQIEHVGAIPVKVLEQLFNPDFDSIKLPVQTMFYVLVPYTMLSQTVREIYEDKLVQIGAKQPNLATLSIKNADMWFAIPYWAISHSYIKTSSESNTSNKLVYALIDDELLIGNYAVTQIKMNDGLTLHYCSELKYLTYKHISSN